MEKYEEMLLDEVRALRMSVDELTKAIMLSVAQRNVAEQVVDDEIVAEPTEVELMAMPFERVLPYKRGICRKLRRQCDTVESLVRYSREELLRLPLGLSEKEVQLIAVELAKSGLSLRDEKVYEVGDEIVQSQDVEGDNAYIMEALREFGIDDWDKHDCGNLWALEAMRFAMNNPSLSREYRTYLWPVIAERNSCSIEEVTDAVRECMNAFALKKRYHFVLREIGLVAREERRKRTFRCSDR